MPLAGHVAFAQGFFAALPDARHHIEEVIATDDRVRVRMVITGTHTGSFFGIPPSGNAIQVHANVVMHIDHGKVAKLGIFDEAGMPRQMGVLPG